MVHRSHFRLTAVAALAVVAAACSRGSNVSNAAPRIGEVPLQRTAGGTVFALDLASYVTDREGAAMTYAVASGGGSFTGSTYSNTFGTMGTYTVAFTVSDGAKTSVGTFDVRVTSANLVVVGEDASGLFLLDSATNAQVRVAAAAANPLFVAGLGDGRLVYRLGSPEQLWLFDPMARTATQLGAGTSGDTVFRAATSDHKVVYTTGPTGNQTIWFYNPLTGVARNVDDGATATVTVRVNVDGMVFYEAAVGGQADVFYYDPTEDQNVTVAEGATDEQIQDVLADGACVFSRVGAGGEADLFYFRIGTGLVEIGNDVGALATRDKTYVGAGSGSQVVFTALDGGDQELWFWDPATGQTTAIATGVDTDVAGIGAGNEVVYNVVVSGSEEDAFFFDLDDGTAATLRDAADVSEVLGVVDGGGTRWAVVRGTGAPNDIHAVSLEGTPTTATWAAGGAALMGGALTNGDVVAQRQDGSLIALFDSSAGSWSAPVAGTGLAFAGDGLDEGDFVMSVTLSAQTDLVMWDASAGAGVTVSAVAGDDVFAARTMDGTILFTRVTAGNSNADLFAWDGAGETQLTDVDGGGLRHDHVVLGQYSGTR